MVQPVGLCGRGIVLDGTQNVKTSVAESLSRATRAREEVDGGSRHTGDAIQMLAAGLTNPAD